MTERSMLLATEFRWVDDEEFYIIPCPEVVKYISV